jgi:hypothetical protein
MKPGSPAWTAPSYGDGYLRFSYANSLANISQALERIRAISATGVGIQ